MKIYKYKIYPFSDVFLLPLGAKILSVGLDPSEYMCIWAGVNPDAEEVSCKVVTVPTGGDVPEGLSFVGTIKNGSFMFHVFAEPSLLS